MSVTIRGRLPKDDRNGLAHLEAALAADPERSILAIVLLQTDTIEDRPHDDDNPRVVKAAILHLEPLEFEERHAADKLLRAAYAARTGKAELELDED